MLTVLSKESYRGNKHDKKVIIGLIDWIKFYMDTAWIIRRNV